MLSSLRLMTIIMLVSLRGSTIFCESETTAETRTDVAVQDLLSVRPADWPWWRGPGRNGVAVADQQPPMNWSETENVAWKAPIPGRGHGSPTVVGGHVYLATCDETRGSQSVLCFDRNTGRQLWHTEVHADGAMRKNERSTGASSTVASDGERLYINFPNRDALYTTALSLKGEILWQTKICDYVIHQGYGSSPALYQSLVIVSADNKGGGKLAALDRATGEFVWQHDRPKLPNYPSPIILHVAGQDQLIMTGCSLISSFQPLTGEILWQVEGATEECVTSTVTDGNLVYSTGGYPRNHMSAVRADGSGEIVWENGTRIYVPSLLIHQGHLYGILDAGVAACWKSDTGEEVWKARLEGNFSSSPVLVGDTIHATNESGKTFLFKASPQEFELLATNQLGEDIFSTPAICGGRIYQRVAEFAGDARQEWLYCLANGEK